MTDPTQITGSALHARGWQTGKAFGLALRAAQAQQAAGQPAEAVLAVLDRVRASPVDYAADAAWGEAARALLAEAAPPIEIAAELRAEPLPYPVWGKDDIDAGSLQQMDNAMRLPVSVAGALMPDAHVGYGLPIGGVLAVEDAVIPYAVGVDIACRMRLSALDASPIVLAQHKGKYEKVLQDNTRFGAGAEWKQLQSDDVMDAPAWEATPLLRSLKDKGARQLGTSGSGNHFVEFGELEILVDTRSDAGMRDDGPRHGAALPEPGTYLALLSHSGSRGVGFAIANAYSKLAAARHPELKRGKGDLSHLGWLDIASEAGQEYWLAMNLAGRYASANHRVIHKNVCKAAGFKALAVVENHHNFAWIEALPDGRRAYVHRKGATPAGLGELGVIPGTMGDPGYVVRGRGNAAALNSASHGAGRRMSRTEAFKRITKTQRDAYLRERGITLLGGGLDEAPMAYKDIDAVMAAQADLVEVIARFRPRVVMMTDDPRDV